jgi:predicted lipid-binding transport protein (Tim44 family)
MAGSLEQPRIMRRFPAFLAAMLAIAVALAPALAEARAGSSMSMGSRGARTYSAPPPTNTAPFTAAPMQRSITPEAPSAPRYTAPPMANPGFAQPSRGSYFMSGLMGGLIGAGIGGLLFGHGMFGGMSGFGSVLGLIIQLAILFFVVRWVLRLIFARRQQPAFAGMGAYARNATVPPGGAAPSRPAQPSVTISRTDYEAFERLLKDVQAAWSAQDLNRLRGLATPEMVGYFGEQLAEQASQGLRNTVTDVRLDQGDLSEAWSEGSREYATVAMRFSMLDATYDASGRLVAGSDTNRSQATELWTFLRSPGGRWVLSAIQQAR